MTPELIVIGTSLGGLNALTAILADLPASMSLPLAVVQHRGASPDSTLAALLTRRTQRRVVDAEDKMPLEAGTVYLAPPDYHLLVECKGMLALSTDPPVRSARPSIDVLFESAAQVYGRSVVGVVLTGASMDGADGLRAIRTRGGIAVVQEPATAECATMPASALTANPTAAVLPLPQLSAYLTALVAEVRA
jgi:two-component system, chemotaxis family, protein-glutamate methylesterase/glutaminase